MFLRQTTIAFTMRLYEVSVSLFIVFLDVQ